MRVLFRVDGGRRYGIAMGHVTRCLELARELNGRGAVCSFLTRPDPYTIALLSRSACPVVQMAEGDDEAKLLDAVEAEIVIVDLRDPERLRLGALRAGGRRVVVLDDTGNIDTDTDLVVNGSVVDRFRRYPGRRRTQYLLGPEFAILGADFDTPAPPCTGLRAERVLVTLGGADPSGLTLAVSRALARRPIPVSRVDVVVGPANDDGPAIIRATAGVAGVAIRRNVASLAELMRDADMVLAAGGRTAYEAAALGVPAVLLPSHPNEVPVAEAFAQAGAARHAVDPEDAIGKLTRLATDSDARAAMRRAGFSLVDGRGRERVAAAICKLFRRASDN